MPFISHTPDEIKQMLNTLGIKSINDLFTVIPDNLKVKGELNLPSALSEMEIASYINQLSGSCNQNLICFAGAGVYDHYIPAVIGEMLGRSEFYTAYTPYQPEVSQGTLQAIFEYQTLLTRLTGMEAANASMYDGGSALAEAIFVSVRSTKRRKVLISEGVNPLYQQVIKTYTSSGTVDMLPFELTKDGNSSLDIIKAKLDNTVAAIVIQQPNFFGIIEDIAKIAELAHSQGAHLIVSADPSSLAVLEAPGKLGADIVTGEGQGLGNVMGYGGPLLGLFACKMELIRQIPGRIVAMTKDVDGQPGFVLTLQTREQHIRREGATSNICTNQALLALAATIYLSLLGEDGLRKVALRSVEAAHELAEGLTGINGCKLAYKGPFLFEFALDLPVDGLEFARAMADEGVLAGVPLGYWSKDWSKRILIAVTEQRTNAELKLYIELANKVIKKLG